MISISDGPPFNRDAVMTGEGLAIYAVATGGSFEVLDPNQVEVSYCLKPEASCSLTVRITETDGITPVPGGLIGLSYEGTPPRWTAGTRR